MEGNQRYFDANVLSALLDVEYRRKMKIVREGNPHLDTLAEGIMSVSILLGTMPAVDAVEVVRCKDCKHWWPERKERCAALHQEPFGWCLCRRDFDDADYREIRKHNDFCSAGERKKDGNCDID